MMLKTSKKRCLEMFKDITNELGKKRNQQFDQRTLDDFLNGCVDKYDGSVWRPSKQFIEGRGKDFERFIGSLEKVPYLKSDELDDYFMRAAEIAGFLYAELLSVDKTTLMMSDGDNPSVFDKWFVIVGGKKLNLIVKAMELLMGVERRTNIPTYVKRLISVAA